MRRYTLLSLKWSPVCLRRLWRLVGTSIDYLLERAFKSRGGLSIILSIGMLGNKRLHLCLQESQPLGPKQILACASALAHSSLPIVFFSYDPLMIIICTRIKTYSKSMQVSRQEKLLLNSQVGGGLLPLHFTTLDQTVVSPHQLRSLLKRHMWDNWPVRNR